MTDSGEVGRDLESAMREIATLRAENKRLARLLNEGGIPYNAEPPGRPLEGRTVVTSQADKIRLFRELFRGREDVFAVRWEGRDGKSGFAPANRYDAERGAYRLRVPENGIDKHVFVTDGIVRDHLTGRHVVGVYPLLIDESCWFLAADFDKSGWERDVAAVLNACDQMSIPAALERSRSGSGGHVWIFFEEPVPASQARKLGCALITQAMELRHQLGLDTYDRLFPNQDTMPRGGFGNLIALPLQRSRRIQHNTEFLDRDFVPYPDQWAFLASVRRVTRPELDAAVRLAGSADAIMGGFDDSRLDTLFLAMPVSWRGTVQQYAGRLHRIHAGKRVVQIYDYVDSGVPMLARMYDRRVRGYEAIGYALLPEGDGLPDLLAAAESPLTHRDS